jgi:hypothetical protein
MSEAVSLRGGQYKAMLMSSYSGPLACYGTINAQTAASQTRIWLDDVALGTSARMGCPEVSASAH